MPVIRAEFSSAGSEIPITQWQLLGPFQFDKRDLEGPEAEHRLAGLNHDYLQDFGLEEASVNASSFLLAHTPKNGLIPNRQFGNRLVAIQPKTNILQLASVQQPFDHAVAYATVIVASPLDQDIVLAAGSDDGMKLWLNHDLLWADANYCVDSRLRKFGRLIGAHLRKGDNFLMVKVCNLTDDWQLIVNLFTAGQALVLARDNGVNPILFTSVINVGENLELRGDLLPRSTTVHLEITDHAHAPVDHAELTVERRFRHKLGKLKSGGLHYCRLSISGETIERPFYYGDLEAGYERLLHQIEKVNASDESVKIDLQAQLARLEHLLRTSSRTSEFWDQKVVSSFVEIESGLTSLQKLSSTFKQAPGSHIRGYRSSVDGQIQHYWIHVPERAQRSAKAMPLVVVLPFITARNQPFLQSYYLAAFDEEERYRILADEYGFSVVQLWGRGNYLGGTAIGTADVFDTLKAIRKDYNIDADRIYLLGYCEGGRLALLLGERFPDRFAAIAADAPITAEPLRRPFAERWVQYASPISAVAQLKNISLLIRHDDSYSSPTFQQSAVFVSRAREAGVDATLVRSEGGLQGFSQNPMGEKRSLFEFFRGKRRHSASLSAASSMVRAFGLGRGPIEDAFGSPILIVEGTRGTSIERAAMHHLVENLQEQWRNAYFVDCPAKKDTEIRDSDMRKNNLIVVGDANTNSIMERMSTRLPIRLTTDGLSLGGTDYRGSQLGYEFIAPNPLHPENYVVVIGMNRWQLVNSWKLHPSRDGICDYFVFDLGGERPQVKGAGYFDDSFWHKSRRASVGQSGTNKGSDIAGPKTNGIRRLM
jgi:poly(3-hydroxybutyrate) depolymerase